MKYIKNLERNSYWKQNKYGYTNNIEEAGLFDEEDCITILRDANILGRVNEIAITKENDVNLKIQSEFNKNDIKEVLEKIQNLSRYETNPLPEVFNTLLENHYYPENDYDNLRNFGQHINYKETFNENIKISGERDLYVKVSIYRDDAGMYELTVYDNYDKPRKERKTRNKPMR